MNDFDALLRPIITERGGRATCLSRDVAKAFGKEHRNILREIDALTSAEPALLQPVGGVLKFEQIPFYEPATGQHYRQFAMSRDGFALLVMGFTGDRALKWKLRYIDAFNAMEAALTARAPAGPVIDVRDPRQLAQIAGQLIEVNAELRRDLDAAQVEIAAAAPARAFYARLVDARGAWGLQQAARLLDQPPRKFIEWLLGEHYLFRQGGALVPYQRWIRKGFFAVKVAHIDGRAASQSLVTAPGLQHLAAALGQTGDLFIGGART